MVVGTLTLGNGATSVERRSSSARTVLCIRKSIARTVVRIFISIIPFPFSGFLLDKPFEQIRRQTLHARVRALRPGVFICGQNVAWRR